MDKDALYAAAMAGDADAISELDLEADKLDKNEKNILQIESISGNAERVLFILRQFANKNLLVHLNYFNQSALLLATSYGHTEVVKILIDAARHLPSASSADNDTPDNPVTSFQAFVRQPDKNSNTALHLAVRNGSEGFVNIVKLIVEADPSDRHIANYQGKTPIYMAAERGLKDIVEVICTICAAQSLEGPGCSTTALHALVKDNQEAKPKHRAMMSIIIDAVKRWSSAEDENTLEALFDRTDESGRNVIDLAVERKNFDAAQLILLEDPAYGRGSKKNGLMRLIFKVIDEKNKDFIEILSRTYQAGIDSCHEGVLDLILAMKRRDKACVLRMLGDNKDLASFVDDQGWTPLHYAAYHEFDSILYAIIEAQKSVGDQFVFGDMVTTPFHVAVEMEYTSTMILLMQSWPDSSSAYTSINKNGQNILHLAADKSKKEMIQIILKYCPEKYMEKILNQQDDNGDTPLHLLISKGCFILELIKHKALDTRVKNKKNWTPRDMFYVEDEIISDQVQIKIALDHVQTNQERDSLESPVLPSKRKTKDVKFKKQTELFMDEKNARMKLDIEEYKKTRAIVHWFSDAIAGNAIASAALEIEIDTLTVEEETILHVESKKGDTARVRFILHEFASKNLLVKLDKFKQTALHPAAKYGHTNVVEVLIDAAGHLHSSTNDDTHNPVASFQSFIRQANVPSWNTALHLAVLDGNVAVVKLLVEADPSDRHVPNNEGKTPIYIAAENGNKDIIQVICTTCTTLSLEGPRGKTTALHAVIKSMQQDGASDVIRMMVDAAKRWSSAEDPSLTDFKALFSRKDESGSTVFQLAVERNYVDAVRLILQEDPAYQHGGEIKRNGLMGLIYKAIDNKYSDDITELLCKTYEAGINPDHKDVLSLILAMKRRDEDCVLRLLGDAKDLVTFVEDNGWTPLHYAVYHEFDSILGVIIEAQEDVGHQFVYQNMISTPFHLAVKHGYISTAIRLMQSWPAPSSAVTAANSPYTAVNEFGQNILHLAAANSPYAAVNEIGQKILHVPAADNRKVMIQCILKYCPEEYKDEILKQQDNNGDTPLHLLISLGCFIPELIKHKGLHTMAKNKNNYTLQDMLYFKSDVIADQVHIKIALNELQANQSAQNLWAKSTVPPSKRRIKDVIFDELIDERKKMVMDAEHEQMKKNLEKYKMRTNTQIIVTALITTVTFTVGFTMPGGLRQSGEVDEGSVLLTKKNVFNVFMVSDALALLLSTSSLFFYFLESMNDDPRQVAKLNAASTVLNIVSVVAMMLTFIAGTYVVLSHSPGIAITVCVIGSLFFLLIIVLLIKIVYDRQAKRNKD